MKPFTRGILFSILFFAFSFSSFSQDTIKMMQYNLMYYTETSGISDCNGNTNSLANKDANIRTIFHHVMPDVFCVCEMGSNISYVNRLLNNAINTDGVDYYRSGPLTNYSGGYIANMIYYNSNKFTLYDHTTISTSYRDINGYKMYYNSNGLVSGDTVFITFWIIHLKAGSGESNENARHIQAQRLMDKIASMGNPGNYVVSGDFNIYDAAEDAYQEMIRYSNSLYRLYDPIDREGNWNNNSSFKDIHTQSTHSNSQDCFSSGGLDDRFDIILVSPYIEYGIDGVRVLPSTYHALGQDGKRFNGSIISPANNSIPSNVAQALYNQSDHLPVITEFTIDAQVGIAGHNSGFYLNVSNPIQDNVSIQIQPEKEDDFHFEIYSLDGRLLHAQHHYLNEEKQKIDIPFAFPHGMYILKVSDSKHQKQVRKLVK